MKFIKIRQIFSVSLLLILLITFIPGCTPPEQPKFGFNPQLSISEPPALGKPVKVTLTFTPQKQFETYSMQIELTPDVYELLEGDLELDAVTGNTNSMEITIKSIVITGSGEIVGRVWGVTPHPTPFETAYLFIQITSDGATILGTTQPKNPPKVTPPMTYPTPTGSLVPNPPKPSYEPGGTIAPSQAPSAGGSAPQQPVVGFKPELTISAAPILGKPVKVTLTFITPSIKGLENKELNYTAAG